MFNSTIEFLSAVMTVGLWSVIVAGIVLVLGMFREH